MLIQKAKGLSTGLLLSGYTFIRESAISMGVTLGGHPQFIRPLISPMAEVASIAKYGKLSEKDQDKIKTYSAATDNFGNFFDQNVFMANSGVLLITGTLETLGYNVATLEIVKYSIPIAIIAFILCVIQNYLLEFILGDYLPSVFVGILIVIIALLSVFKQVNIGTLKQLDETFTKLKADKLGLKIFIPSLAIAIAAMLIAQFTKLSGTVAIGLASFIALILTFIITKATPVELTEDSNRMLQSVGKFAIIPPLLGALGAVFTDAGVGDIISKLISNIIPEGNILAGVIAYCVSMALFTAIIGNVFAAFSVITVGIGLPFVFMQGGNPLIAGTLAMTAGFCGTLITPMAAILLVIQLIQL